MALTGHVDEISRSAVEGWVVDTDRPELAVSVSILVDGVHRGMCLTALPRTDLILPDDGAMSGECGFRFAFDPPLSPFVELKIDVIETWSVQVLPNGSRILPRPRLPGRDDGGITPILVTSTGRTGTTLLMSEFAAHQDAVVGDYYPYEIKQIAYHAAAFRALAADADWQRSTAPDTMLAPEMQRIVGGNPYNMSALFDLGGPRGVLRDFYQDRLPSGFATLFRDFILAFYATLAAAQGKPSARYFCEKGDIDDAAVQGARLFFDVVKDIVIVRDPRDLLCSAIAFWKLSPETAMQMLLTTIPRLTRIVRQAGADTMVVRYEDLVREPIGTRRELSRFLDMDLLGQPATGDLIPDSHRTSRGPAASIGRWRDDLTPQQVETCEIAFGPYMQDFDYEMSAVPKRRTRLPSDPRNVSGNQIVAEEGVLAVAAFIENTVEEGGVGLRSRHVWELTFGTTGTGEAFLLEGWSRPEHGFVWSNATKSLLRLPPIRRDGEYWLHITASPFTHGERLPAQRVTVLFDDDVAGTALVRDICVLSVPIPPAASQSGNAIALTMRFPDAACPSEILGIDDARTLGFALHRIALFQVDTQPDAADPEQAVRRPRATARDICQNRGIWPLAEGDLPRSETTAEIDSQLADRVTDLSREAFRRPELEYHGRRILRGIPGYASSRFVRLILALEAEFGISLHEDEVDHINTMGDIVALVSRKVMQDERSAKGCSAG
jgi:hypothetical protein